LNENCIYRSVVGIEAKWSRKSVGIEATLAQKCIFAKREREEREERPKWKYFRLLREEKCFKINSILLNERDSRKTKIIIEVKSFVYFSFDCHVFLFLKIILLQN